MFKKRLRICIYVWIYFFSVVPLHAGILFSSNFDNENVTCWNDINDVWRSCGDFYDIGKGDRMQLSSKHSHSGSYAVIQKLRYNEDRGQAYIRLASPMSHTRGYDELYVQVWNYFTGDDGNYDHGTQQN